MFVQRTQLMFIIINIYCIIHEGSCIGSCTSCACDIPHSYLYWMEWQTNSGTWSFQNGLDCFLFCTMFRSDYMRCYVLFLYIFHYSKTASHIYGTLYWMVVYWIHPLYIICTYARFQGHSNLAWKVVLSPSISKTIFFVPWISKIFK